jgi:hypothetical protein
MEAAPDVTMMPDTGMMDAMVDAGPGPCGTPTFMPNGGSVTTGSTVTIVPPTGFPMSGFIFFTTDGTLPTHSSPAYSGPIQVNQDETIRAIAYAAGVCSDSAYAMASFTVMAAQVDAGGVNNPSFNPGAEIVHNDFTVTLSGDPGATICYAFGSGAMPTCTNGTCQPGSTTYTGTPISINGMVTDATTGQVTLSALSCKAGSTNSAVVPQTYTLQASPPVMVMPDNSKALAYNAAGTSYTPTISSPTNGSFIRFFTGTNTPDCTTGTGMQLTNPYQFTGTAATSAGGAITQNTLFQTVSCKTGYAPSAVTPIQYWVQLNQPTYAKAGGKTYDTATVTGVVDDTANGGSSDWLCYTTDNSSPGCGATASTCATGSTAGAPQVTADQQQINVIACSASNGTMNSGFQSSAIPDSSGVYTLQLDPIDFNPPGAGVAQYQFVTADGTSRPVTIQQNGTGDAPAYVCVGKTAPVDCTCNTATGHGTQHAIGDMVTVAPGDTWTGYACSANTATIENSPVTTATYTAIGAPVSPSISPASGNYMAQQTIVLTNNGTGAIAQYLCWTTNGTPPAPGASCTTSGATTCTTSTIPVTTSSVAGTYTVPTKIQASNTVVEAIGCNSTQSATPTPTTTTYTFQLAQPDVTASTTGDLDTGGAVSGNQSITLSTTSDFSGETLNWSDNNTSVNCTTAQHPGATSPVTYTVPTNATSVTLNIIACGTAQTASSVRTVTLSIATGTPVITNTGADGSHTPGTTSLTWENSFNATISTTTPGATICYRTNGSTTGLACTAGACDSDPNTVSTAAPATVNIGQSGIGLVAVACTPTLASTGVASMSYTLNVTPVTVTPSGTCPKSFSIGPATSTIGGPTTAATLCYSTTGTFSYCGPQAGAPTGVTCGGYASTPVLTNIYSSATIWATTCKTGFVGDTGSSHAATVNPDTSSGITVNGTLDTGEWAAGNTLAGTASTTGYYTTDGTNLYFAATGYTAAATTDVVIFIGDGTSDGSPNAPNAYGGGAIGFSAKWAFAWATNGQSAPIAYLYNGGWGVTTFSPAINVGFVSGSTVEFGLALSNLGALPAPATIDVRGEIISGVGSSPAVAAYWPSAGTSHYVADVLTSCQAPTGEVQ